MQPLACSTVIYAKDMRRVAEFYKRTLALVVLESEVDFILVGRSGLEITVVQVPEDIAKGIHIAMPPSRREETPIKGSFLVEDLERVHTEAAAAGGGTKPVVAAWRWRGQLHLDGYDPEGNVVQFRVLDAQPVVAPHVPQPASPASARG
jgi:predicted enzyme related to lactoylglutathione lyase